MLELDSREIPDTHWQSFIANEYDDVTKIMLCRNVMPFEKAPELIRVQENNLTKKFSANPFYNSVLYDRLSNKDLIIRAQ